MHIHHRIPHAVSWLLVALAFAIALSVTASGPTAQRASAGAARQPGGTGKPDRFATRTGTQLPANLAARLPVFPPAPTPDPVAGTPGPDAGWFSAMPTTRPVAFLTIDDGYTKDPELIDVLRAAHIRVTLFLEINAIRDDPDYFRRLVAAGAVIEAHTISHPDLVGMSYPAQRREICGGADQLQAWYGRRPVLFRPPYGHKDAATLRAVHDCGMKAAFTWRETVNAGIVRYQHGAKIQAGDIVLMHFRPTVVQDFLAALQAIHDAGLTPALLEDYVGGDAPAVTAGDRSLPTPDHPAREGVHPAG